MPRIRRQLARGLRRLATRLDAGHSFSKQLAAAYIEGFTNGDASRTQHVIDEYLKDTPRP